MATRTRHKVKGYSIFEAHNLWWARKDKSLVGALLLVLAIILAIVASFMWGYSLSRVDTKTEVKTVRETERIFICPNDGQDIITETGGLG